MSPSLHASPREDSPSYTLLHLKMKRVVYST
jgi:hypothetical protein